MTRRFIPGLVVLLAAACTPLRTGRLEANRFQHDRYPYAVFYAQPTPKAPFGADFVVDERASAGTDRGETKSGEGRYTLNRVYDLNADGRGDFQRLEPRYDLLLENTKQDAALWVATFPLAERESSTGLDALAQRYVEAMAAQGELSPSFGPESTAPKSQGAASVRVSEARPCSLSKRDALRIDATFSQGGQNRATSLVLVRTGYGERVTDGANGAGRYAVFMVVGVMAHEAQRTGLEPTYDSFLTHTVLGDRGLGLSMQGEGTCGSTPPPAQGSEAPAAAPVEGSPEQLLQPMPADEPTP